MCKYSYPEIAAFGQTGEATAKTYAPPVLLHGYDSIGFKSFHLHWVSPLLIHGLRKKRKESAKAMLTFLYAAEPDDWHHLGTGNKSWLFWNTSPCHM
jgi:hypothetical protein